jgi:curved DNA-binding protein CbpA
VTDHFALLNEPRRPWIEPDALKEKFLAFSSQFHPDRIHSAPEPERQAASRRFSDINAAYNCLREPKDRLRHLLELELGMKPTDIQEVPVEVTNSFFEIGRLCKDVDAFLTEKSHVTSPMLKVERFERGQEWIERINLTRQKIESRREILLEELKAMNPAWEAASADSSSRDKLPLKRIDEIYRLLGYLGRWSEQLQERFVQLSFD